MVIEDPLPAGLETLNDQLATTSTNEVAGGASTGLAFATGVDHAEVYDDRVLLFATQLSPGTFEYVYVARATAPGTFLAAPMQTEEMYRPEIFGRTATATVTVQP